jgi:hypothetical protein
MNVVVTEQGQSQQGPIDAARTWLDEFGRVTLATVISTWGSSPVPVGVSSSSRRGTASKVRCRAAALRPK